MVWGLILQLLWHGTWLVAQYFRLTSCFVVGWGEEVCLKDGSDNINATATSARFSCSSEGDLISTFLLIALLCRRSWWQISGAPKSKTTSCGIWSLTRRGRPSQAGRALGRLFKGSEPLLVVSWTAASRGESEGSQGSGLSGTCQPLLQFWVCAQSDCSTGLGSQLVA